MMITLFLIVSLIYLVISYSRISEAVLKMKYLLNEASSNEIRKIHNKSYGKIMYKDFTDKKMFKAIASYVFFHWYEKSDIRRIIIH